MSNTTMSSTMGVIKPGAFGVNGATLAHKEENASLISLKNGKVTFKQKPYSLEKMSETMQETVKFRDFLHERSKNDSTPLQRIPDEHLPLVAKLVYESDKTLAHLTKQVQQILALEDDEGGKSEAVVLSPSIESAITSVAERVNYGIDWTEKTSASLNIWRWEMKDDRFDLLPRAAKEKVESRISERRQAKRDLRTLYEELPESERASLGKTQKKVHVLSVNDENKNSFSESNGSSPSKNTSTDNVDGTTEEKKMAGRPKKEKDPDQIQKENELAEKRAAKLEKERKKEENQNKSRSLMSSFFSKSKTNHKLLHAGSSSKSPILSDPSSSRSDFERSFKPYIVKKHAKMAPVNFFRSKTMSVGVIDLEEECSVPSKSIFRPKTDAYDTRSAEDLMADLKKSMKSATHPKCRKDNVNGIQYKSTSEFCVRDIMARLSEAEVIGKDEVVRELQGLLQDRKKIPAKVLIFEEDSRPGYFGTFTKSSTAVGPRTPFARDPVAFDYSYDSGEEWEDEGEGDDLLSGHGSDVEVTSDVGSEDMDGWLVDDDDVGDPGTPLSERQGSPGFPSPCDLQVKRKAEADNCKQKKEMKKRKVVPLLPFIKENRLEDRIGDCDDEVFIPFRMQLFNDTPFPIDPFTFVAEPIKKPQAPPKTQQQFAIPAVPAHVQAPGGVPMAVSAAALNTDIIPVAIPVIATAPAPLNPQNIFNPVQYQAPTAASQATPSKRVPVQPKNPFPAALMPYLADKVASLNSGNLTWVVESLYQDLKTHGVRKIAIEAKIREDCEKCPQRKVWTVKNEVLASLGKAPSAPTA